jgi:uncharacterized protein (TIGR02266 family)
MSDHGRQSKRHPSNHPLLVECESWVEFAEVYATDVSQGGMFIATDEPPPILSEIGIKIRLPEGHEIALRANVVHVLSAEQAAREGRPPGVGVQFVELDPMRRQQIYQLVEFARWEGTSGQPSSSYATHMFEVSASMPPSQVLRALPEDQVGAPNPAEAAPRASSAAGAASMPPAKIRTKPSMRSPVGEGAHKADGPSMPPKPSDPAKLKLGMTHLAHKHYDQAVKTFEQMLRDNAGDRTAQQWLQITHARARLKANDEEGAVAHYKKALEAAEDNHEARKFVRAFASKKRLSAIPFGRYFVKKS